MHKLKKFGIPIRKFFWWSAGVVPSILENCPTNHGKYTAIGVIMAFIAVLASVSFAFFLSHTFVIPAGAALLGGIFWGILIYSLDRAVLTSFRKDEMSRISVAQRFILTISLALIVGEPLLMHLFRKEIAFEMARKSQTVSANSRQNATDRFQTEIDSLLTSNREIENRLDELKADRDSKENAVIGEIEGASGSGKKGDGPAAARKNTAFAEADAKYKEFKTDSAETLSENKKRLAEIRGAIEDETRKIGDANAESDGVLAKHEALFDIIKTQPGAALVYFPLFLGLLFLETLPLSIKVFGKKSVYDAALEAVETETVEEIEAENNRRRNIRKAVEDRISASIIRDEIENLRHKAERKVAEKISAEVLREIENRTFRHRAAKNSDIKFGEEIAVEVVGCDDLQIKLQLPESVRREISLNELGGDIKTIADETGAENLKLTGVFSSEGHEIWEDLPLLPQLESDQKLILQFEPAQTV